MTLASAGRVSRPSELQSATVRFARSRSCFNWPKPRPRSAEARLGSPCPVVKKIFETVFSVTSRMAEVKASSPLKALTGGEAPGCAPA